MTRGDLYNYLMVLYKLVPQLRVCHDNLLGDDTDSEDDDMDVDQQVGVKAVQVHVFCGEFYK